METFTDKLSDRMKLLIDVQTDKRGKFGQLEAMTGIPADNWKSFYYGRQRPNPDMIEAVGTAWPQYAVWLVTGQDVPELGLLRPDSKDLGCNIGPYLSSKIAAAQVTRELMLKYFEEKEPDNSESHDSISKAAERHIHNAHHVLKGEHDPEGRYSAAMTKVRVEREKHQLEISGLPQAVYSFAKSLKAYPWIIEDTAQKNFNALMLQAKEEKTVFQNGDGSQ
ncbi:hypothetical protein HBDW_43480 [Herbaspirillum sp. DW155]|uniref:hypothetical protein n=1 Tax=Herbaspirillum sp. DW155 TaxID=3095609 RepID=UPI0030873F9D|nr:hypothetical protein HBDW_43480 [Herbaspirillum sp. DW155]